MTETTTPTDDRGSRSEEFPTATFVLTEPIALSVEDNGIVEFPVFLQRG